MKSSKYFTVPSVLSIEKEKREGYYIQINYYY